MRAIGSFIFAGGFTFGVTKHFDVIAHLETGPFGTGTFKANFPHVPVYIGQETWPIERLNGVDFLYFNCPCAPWSSQAGGMRGRDSWKDDPRTDHSRLAFDLFHKIQPRAMAWESVTRAFSCGQDFIHEQAERALDAGYSVTVWLMDLQHHGLPQRRQRGFLIFTKPRFDLTGLTFQEPISAGQALANAIDDHTLRVAPQYQALIEQTPPGQRASDVFNQTVGELEREYVQRGGRRVVRGRPAFMVRRLDPDLPSFTLTSHACQAIHPTEHRYLSVDEVRRLCGYPDNMVFDCPPNQRFAELTQAVTPVAGELVARFVRQALERDETGIPEAWLVDTRKCQLATRPLFN